MALPNNSQIGHMAFCFYGLVTQVNMALKVYKKSIGQS